VRSSTEAHCQRQIQQADRVDCSINEETAKTHVKHPRQAACNDRTHAYLALGRNIPYDALQSVKALSETPTAVRCASLNRSTGDENSSVTGRYTERTAPGGDQSPDGFASRTPVAAICITDIYRRSPGVHYSDSRRSAQRAWRKLRCSFRMWQRIWVRTSVHLFDVREVSAGPSRW